MDFIHYTLNWHRYTIVIHISDNIIFLMLKSAFTLASFTTVLINNISDTQKHKKLYIFVLVCIVCMLSICMLSSLDSIVFYNITLKLKQDACSGVYSACREENRLKVGIMYNCSGREHKKWLFKNIIIHCRLAVVLCLVIGQLHADKCVYHTICR